MENTTRENGVQRKAKWTAKWTGRWSANGSAKWSVDKWRATPNQFIMDLVLLSSILWLGLWQTAGSFGFSPCRYQEKEPYPTFYRSTKNLRVVAIGDLHGDFVQSKRILFAAGLINSIKAKRPKWTGGSTMVIQTGDRLDRGTGELEIIELFKDLDRQARNRCGAVIPLLGNHEIMNMEGDFRFVFHPDEHLRKSVDPDFKMMNQDLSNLKSWKAWKDFLFFSPLYRMQNTRQGFEPFFPWYVDIFQFVRHKKLVRGRIAAFGPGSAITSELSKSPIVIVVNDTLYLHGGMTSKYVDYGLEKMNQMTRDWVIGKNIEEPAFLTDSKEGPIWSRRYSDNTQDEQCKELTEILDKLKLKRMVVGHTVQRKGINSFCDDKVWRIDVGISSYFGGIAQALEFKYKKGQVQPQIKIISAPQF